jgi:hypothetical protein
VHDRSFGGLPRVFLAAPVRPVACGCQSSARVLLWWFCWDRSILPKSVVGRAVSTAAIQRRTGATHCGWSVPSATFRKGDDFSQRRPTICSADTTEGRRNTPLLELVELCELPGFDGANRASRSRT